MSWLGTNYESFMETGIFEVGFSVEVGHVKGEYERHFRWWKSSVQVCREDGKQCPVRVER